MNQKIMGVTVGTPHRPDAVAKKIGPFLVTVAQNEDGSYAVDKTYGELVEAKSAGRTLRCRYYDDDVYLPFTAYHGLFTFSAVIDSKLYQIDITAAGQSQEAQAKVTTTPLSSSGGSDGITPHIGANGNWWIGEEDTGVSAGVTDEQISGAVEEYLEENPLVKTVNGTAPDENGNVELDIQSGGDGWTLLYNETTSEVVSSICATLDGSYTEFIVYLETAYDENVTKLLNLCINGAYVSEGSVNRNSVRKNIFHVITSPKNGFVKCEAAYQCAGFGNSAASSVGFARNVKFSDTVTIDAVTRGDAGTTGKIFAVGTTFTVWGRK